MADKIVIPATLRTEFGKGAARQARRSGQIPAVVYGHGEDPIHLLLPNHETTLAVRNPNALITLDIEGKKQLVLPKDIQRDAIYRSVDHLDLLAVRSGEKVVVDAPVEVIGEPASGFEYLLDQPTVAVEAEATHLPESISIDITDRDENALPEHLQLPAGVTLALTDLESPVVTIYEPTAQDLGEDEGAEEAEAADEAPAEESGEGEDA
ncbi:MULTISPECIES: 50S ribosomal protein L25/general stress protein Ctc [Actinomycetes]|uniref:Large ribosomal subunit protein bL25 n=2 Tax=Actinomycetes TaxID=1760 RepID=A0ABP6M1T4_9MICC|nr:MULTISPECIES: 50S ribosomal protein L25/general stress protein Ctc [unclassified Nesterenkonia]MDS2173875.1 50S ribosomal protein L25/general stress protein Ctc [Nesterenkonia sp. CL21]OSM43401.1 50S ribosomal protein L25/general stress protein Ctc [Nesterenkonia sp. PF2B19]